MALGVHLMRAIRSVRKQAVNTGGLAIRHSRREDRLGQGPEPSDPTSAHLYGVQGERARPSPASTHRTARQPGSSTYDRTLLETFGGSSHMVTVRLAVTHAT